MILSTKLLNLLGAIAIFGYWMKVAAENLEEDEDSNLKQALFLVELLKSDFAKILRENTNYSERENSTGDTNTTCSIPLDDANGTAPINSTVAANDVTSSDNVTAKSASDFVTHPEMPLMQFSSWPPKPMPGFPIPLGPNRQGNLPDENYRFPYRFNRRRMMPDYYYFESPVQNRGKFRRLNDPSDDLGNDTATTPTLTTTIKVPSTPSERTTSHVEEIATTTTVEQTSTSVLPMTETSTLSPPAQSMTTRLPTQSTTETSTHLSTDLFTQISTDPSQLPNDQSIQLSTEPSSHLPAESPTQQATDQTTRLFKSQKRVRAKTRMHISKAEAAISSVADNNRLKLDNVHRPHYHLRHKKTTSENIAIEDIEMSQVASELIKELNGTKPENTTDPIVEVSKHKQSSKKKRSSTLKIFLKGSSRLPTPLPENNGFCHSHPNNPLCSTA